MIYRIRRQLYIAACINLGLMMVGYGLGWTAPVTPKLLDLHQSPLPEVITEREASWVGSLLYIGGIIGPHITGYLSNVIGRKPSLLIGGFLTLISYIMVTMTKNLAMIYTLRIIKGFGIGIIGVCSIVYLGEISSTNIRGILLTSTGIFSTIGTLLVYCTAPYVTYEVTGYIGIVVTIFYIVSLLFVPETPVFKILKDRNDEASIIMETLGRQNEKESVIKSSMEAEKIKRHNMKFLNLVTDKSNRKALFITVTLQVLQNMSGVVAVIFFLTTVFKKAGSSIRPDIATIIIGVAQLTSSIIVPFFIEKTGRRVLLLVSTAFCCLGLVVLGTYFYLDDIGHPFADLNGWIPLVSLIIFFLSYDMGLGIIPNTLIGEMFSISERSNGSAIAMTLGWLVGFGVAFAFGHMLSTAGGHVTFWFFSGVCALAFLFTVVFVPETKGKSLADIQKMLS